MFEDKNMMKYISALIGFCSIIIPGPIVPLVCLVIGIAMLVVKIKQAKESPEGFESLMLDIVCIVIVIVIDIVFTVYRVWLVAEYTNPSYDSPSSSSSQEMTASDFADRAVAGYKLRNILAFENNKNKDNRAQIKSTFINYLKNELEMEDVKTNGDNVIVKYNSNQIVFTILLNDIRYKVR